MNLKAYIAGMASIHPTGMDEQAGYHKAVEPDYKEAIQNPSLRRRMSKVVKMGVACGLNCISAMPQENINSIITATGLGCLADTEKFMNNLLDNNESLLNPTPFIQSTFNTVGAQIALISRNQSYNVTYVHRGASFESALLDGLLRISEGSGNVLVGAFDEVTDASLAIQKRLGILSGTNAGEGSQFFLLSKEKKENTFIEITAPYIFSGLYEDEEPETRIQSYLADNGINENDISMFVTGRNGNKKQDAIYTYIKEKLFSNIEEQTFKHICGEYQTASSFALWHTVNTMIKKDICGKYALIYNHYNNRNHSVILVNKSI